MQGPGPESGDDTIAQINIIPLVDVVLVLLIIFMVTTVFARDSQLKLNLPKGSRPEQNSAQPAEVTVSIARTGDIFVNGKPTPIDKIDSTVMQFVNKNRETILVVKGDKDAVYGKIMPVLDEVSRTGVKITLALLPASPSKK